jgi:transposase
VESEVEQKRPRRTSYPEEFKRQLVQQACDPAVSVSQLALQHGLNANMLFRWRREFQARQMNTVRLMPVTLAPNPGEPCVQVADAGGTINIELGDITVCIKGRPDPATLSLVLKGLRG